MTHRIVNDELMVAGEAYNPNEIAMDNLFCVAYEPRTVVWGPVTLAPKESVEISVTLKKSESKHAGKISLTRRVGQHLIQL